LVADRLDHASTVAVRYNEGERHSHRERVLPLLDVARIDARGGDLDANLAPTGRRCWRLPYREDLGRSALALVPSCPREPLSLPSTSA